jgi:hypothetical protein
MSSNVSSKKIRGELQLDDATLFAPQSPYMAKNACLENRSCATCGKIITTTGLCDLCQIIFKFGMAYVAEQVASKSLEAVDPCGPSLDGPDR